MSEFDFDFQAMLAEDVGYTDATEERSPVASTAHSESQGFVQGIAAMMLAGIMTLGGAVGVEDVLRRATESDTATTSASRRTAQVAVTAKQLRAKAFVAPSKMEIVKSFASVDDEAGEARIPVGVYEVFRT